MAKLAPLLDYDEEIAASLDLPAAFNKIRRLNSGLTSVVFDGGKGKVWRMTVDAASHKVITNAMLGKGGFLPRCYENLGRVGRYQGMDVYLGLFERLRPRYRSRNEVLPIVIDKEFQRITNTMNERALSTADWNRMVCDVVCAAVWKWAAEVRHGRPVYARDLTFFLQRLRDAATREESYLDLHEDNIMYRPGSGDLVVADPVVSSACLNANPKRRKHR